MQSRFIPLALLLLSACTQQPVDVVYKGGEYFGRNNAAAYGSPANARAGFVPEYNQNYTTEASVPSVGVNELAPITVAPAAPVSVTPVRPVGSSFETNDSRTYEHAPVYNVSAKQAASDNGHYLRLPDGKGYAPSVDVSSDTDEEILAPLPTVTHSREFIWPVEGKLLSSFGRKEGGQYNDGINISADEGEPVWAVADGEVVFASDEMKDYGNMIILRHADGLMTSYAHTSGMEVKKGDTVKQGQLIGNVGSTGNVKTPQLFFSVREGKDAVDPMSYLNRSLAALDTKG